jgi:uncharacterized protein (DUF1697 family)
VPADLEARLQAVDAGDDQYAISGRELYLWCPHGQLESPLAAALAADRVSPTGTARNWRTVGKVAELLRR